LGLVLSSRGRPAEAETLAREALATRTKLLGEPEGDVAHSLNLLAGTLAEQGKLGEAEACHREALGMRRLLFGDDHPDVAFSRGALGAVLAREGKLAEAETALRESLALQRRLLPTGHPESLVPVAALAKLLLKAGKTSEAAEVCGQTADNREALLNRVARTLATCAHAPVRDGVAAVGFAEEAVAGTKRKDPAYLETLAAAYAEAGRFPDAVKTQEEAIALWPPANAQAQTRLSLYLRNIPCRDPGGENSANQ